MPAGDKIPPVHFGNGSAGDCPFAGRGNRRRIVDRLGELLAFGQLAEVTAWLRFALVWKILPSATVSEARSAFKYSAAMSSNTSRAAAATRCKREAICGVVMAAESARVIRDQVRVRHHHFDGGHRRPQFLGHGLASTRCGCFAHFRFARENRHRAVLADMRARR